ncbi:MAG: hypothetical protein HQM16_16415 [Deltaproteobacteria bacterium]|nr:hypothetical protein [Deltaproteobacteria bacterium]
MNTVNYNTTSFQSVSPLQAGKTGSPEDVLGPYRDPCERAYYANDPVLFDIEHKSPMALHHTLTPGLGPLGATGTGAIYEGSQKVVVYGRKGKATSWEFYEYKKTGDYIGNGWPLYGWVRSTRGAEDVKSLPIVKEAVEKYNSQFKQRM